VEHHAALPGRETGTVMGRRAQPANVADAALAHPLGSNVQAANQRGDLPERRRKLKDGPAAFCARTEGAKRLFRSRPGVHARPQVGIGSNRGAPAEVRMVADFAA
jgi:hypothetical protein